MDKDNEAMVLIESDELIDGQWVNKPKLVTKASMEALFEQQEFEEEAMANAKRRLAR